MNSTYKKMNSKQIKNKYANQEIKKRRQPQLSIPFYSMFHVIPCLNIGFLSLGLFQAVLVTHNRLRDILKYMFNDEDPIICRVGRTHKQKKSTRGIWKVLSMAFYLSNQFTNPIMFGIILNNYLSFLL